MPGKSELGRFALETAIRGLEFYNEYFDRVEQNAARLNELYPQPSEMPIVRKSREQFERFLSSGTASESKRLFLERVLNGREELLPLLPEHVRTLAGIAA